ncbi:hypothetical protein D915_000820 [Fasciola hepatica]|uniref:Uncharacterized protein n=1 Tax=Fasciola hepatica TaxID=6192 RepID=A0A2H1CUY3_FASHE|nr:hypothetical protein D915_000820 [Fasciola hepatica]
MEDEQCKETSLLKFESEEADKLTGKNKVLNKKLVIYCGLLMLFSTVALVIGVTQVRIISRFSARTVHPISDILSACLVSCVTSLLSLIGLRSFCFSKPSSLKMLMISLTAMTFLLVRSFVITIFQSFEISRTLTRPICLFGNTVQWGERNEQSQEQHVEDLQFFMANEKVEKLHIYGKSLDLEIDLFQLPIGATKLTEILILANGFMGGMLLLSAVLSLLIVYLIQNYEQDYMQLKNKDTFMADMETDIVYI